MSRRLVLLALAQKDILEAEAYYGSISERLADRFSNELERTIEVLIRYPEGFQMTVNEFRQAPLDNFPYVLVYRLMNDEIVIFRLFHTSQDPDRKFAE